MFLKNIDLHCCGPASRPCPCRREAGPAKVWGGVGCEMARCRLADEHSSGAGRREIDRILYSISDEGQMSRKPESPKHQSIVLYSP